MSEEQRAVKLKWKTLRSLILQAIARAWTDPRNSYKIIDRDIADAATNEVAKLFTELFDRSLVELKKEEKKQS